MKRYSLVMLASLLTVLVACKDGGVAPSTLSSTLTPTIPSIPTDGAASYALVYGSSASDRQYLSDRIAGYQAPGLSVVFSQWRRFSGGSIYNTTADITPKTPAYCFTSFDSNYNWVNGTNGSTTISPGTYTNCVNSNTFIASSWNYIASPDRIYNAANGSYFNGFISALKFLKYNLQATVTSTDADDDGIGLVIAAVVDSSNNVHTLTAMRTQGGMTPSQGWGILYKMNNTEVRTFGARSVGGIVNNWGGKKSLLSVSRDGDIIKASASNWFTGSSSGVTVDPASEITIDLSDSSLGLSVFQGEQYYGYGTISQLGATFSDIVFTSPNSAADPTYLYDLVNNTVYFKDSTAGYTLVPGAQAMSILGFPIRVKNNETQKEFRIDSASSFVEL